MVQKVKLIGQRGFTLIEMLLVLFILTIMLLAAPPLFNSLYSTIEKDNFLHQFEQDIFNAQARAIANMEPIYYKYDPQLRKYEFTNFYKEVLFSRSLPENVTIKSGYMDNFRFLGTGNVSRFGNIYLQIGDKNYRVYIGIGRGRLEIYEEG